MMYSPIPAPCSGARILLPIGPMNNEPWKEYFDEFRRRAERIPDDAFDRGTLLYEAAHDAYEKTTNDLTTNGVDPERALVIGRMFGTVVKNWVERDGKNVSDLERDLRSQYTDWTAGESDGRA